MFWLGNSRRRYVLSVVLSLSLSVFPTARAQENHDYLVHRQGQELPTRQRQKPCGNHRGLVLLWKLTDYDTLPREWYDTLFNTEEIDDEIAPSGSVQQYIRENSLGRFTIEWTVADWVQSTKSEVECAGSSQGMSENLVECFSPSLDALEAMHNDPAEGFDWNDFDLDQDGYIDHMVVIFNGYDGENSNDDPSGTPASSRIHAHAHEAEEGSWVSPSTGIQPLFYATVPGFRGMKEPSLMRFNIAIHQFIMSFGAIDLFDASLIGYGCGGYCIMAYDIGPQMKPVDPGNVGAYSRLFLDWGEPILIIEDGEYELTPSFVTGQVYKIQPASYDAKEYLLIENRPLLKWDQLLWGNGGIVIWHVNENVASVDQDNARVRVVQADGLYDLENGVNLADEGDLWVEGLELSDDGDPNIKSVVNGNPSGLLLSDFSPPQEIARFRVSGLVASPPSPFPQFVCSDNVTQVPGTEPTTVPDSIGNETATPSYLANETLSPSPSLSTGAPTVQGCIPIDDPAAPPIYNPRECSLSVGAESCAPLLATISPDPSCDCHNFCDGKYVGCCEYSSACPIICPSMLIAGCVFPPITCQPGNDPSPLPTSSDGNQTPAPSSSTTETEPGCMIASSTGDCPSLMRNVELKDSCTCYNFCNGMELPCCTDDRECPALSCNGDFVAGCRKEDKSPAPRCLIQSNTASCSSLTMGQEYFGGSCDCANYCNGNFIGCCPFDVHCDIQCKDDSVVAGCRLTDDAIVAPAQQGYAAPFFFWPDGFETPKYDEGEKRRLLGNAHQDL